MDHFSKLKEMLANAAKVGFPDLRTQPVAVDIKHVETSGLSPSELNSRIKSLELYIEYLDTLLVAVMKVLNKEQRIILQQHLDAMPFEGEHLNLLSDPQDYPNP